MMVSEAGAIMRSAGEVEAGAMRLVEEGADEAHLLLRRALLLGGDEQRGAPLRRVGAGRRRRARRPAERLRAVDIGELLRA